MIDHHQPARAQRRVALLQKVHVQLGAGNTVFQIQIKQQQVDRLGQRFHVLLGACYHHLQLGHLRQRKPAPSQLHHRRTELYRAHLSRLQVLQHRTDQAAGAQPQRQRSLDLWQPEPRQQHRAGVVVLQPGRVADQRTALFSLLAKVEVT